MFRQVRHVPRWRIRWLGLTRMNFSRWEWRSSVAGPGIRLDPVTGVSTTPRSETLTDGPGVALGLFEVSRRPPT